MPGLQLTISQASRLLGIEHDACRDVIETLVASSFLRRTPAGTVVRTER
jgi:Holliday junction resolvasome RuvABC ATP-dependent DNA helicase subunit